MAVSGKTETGTGDREETLPPGEHTIVDPRFGIPDAAQRRRPVEQRGLKPAIELKSGLASRCPGNANGQGWPSRWH